MVFERPVRPDDEAGLLALLSAAPAQAVVDRDCSDFATHAEVDVIDPLSSSILLAREGTEPALLEAREVYGLKLGGVSLVTLSACESGPPSLPASSQV